MDIKQQTKVSERNCNEFYKQMYRQPFDAKSQLVNLEQFSTDCILIDCCGWHYRDLFPNNNIISLETVKTVLEFKLDPAKFNKLIDNQQDNRINWPPVVCSNPVLIFDRSPILKYRTVSDLVDVLSNAVQKYQASQLIVNLHTTFIDDPRLMDRFNNFSKICISGFTIKEFVYTTSNDKLFMHFKRNYVVQSNSH